MRTIVTCIMCGTEFEAEDLSDMFEYDQNHYTCDECYAKVQRGDI